MAVARIGQLTFLAGLFVAYATSAVAEDISGTINATRIVVGDSQLVGNVVCTTTTAPCIQFGAPGITLRLNGYAITGPANPDDTTLCNATSGAPAADGIVNGTSAATSQPDVRIIGPGMVQRFRRHGIFIIGAPGVTTNATVKNVTSHHNCFSGVFLSGGSGSLVDGVVSVRNAVQSGTAPCGGNCITNSNGNHIVNSMLGGNGSVCNAALCSAAPTVASNNDFGVGLVGTSAGNVIENNSMAGNSNGILITAAASGNTIRGNVVAGNPAAQITRTYGVIGFDIKDDGSVGTRNTFEKNWCITYSGPGPSPCPSLPAVEAPVMSTLTATPDLLWPANGQMVAVTIGASATDDTDPAPVCQISSVASSEDATSVDWVQTGPLSLLLRADRDGLGTGRTYTITVICTNAAQLSSSATTTVFVPHDRR